MLRRYQKTAISDARKQLRKYGSCVLQMPTGAGKTRTAAEIIATTRGVVWFICHRREIMRQAADAFTAAGIDFGMVSPRHEFEPNKRVQIASVGTLPNCIEKMRQPGLVIWDECHHVAAGSWAKIRESLLKAKHLGLTATPERLDGQGLSDWFKSLVCGPSVKKLTPKYLSDFKYFAPSEPDLTKVRTGKGDYAKKDRERLMDSPVLIGDAISEYKKNIPGKRAIVFAASTSASRKIVRRFNKAGIVAAHVDATTPTDERDAAIAALKSGEIKVLSNVEVFTEGFDLPAIDAVILMRPTKSLQMFLQMVGRGLRNAPGKKQAYIFDHAGLWLTHGMPDAEWAWSLEGKARDVRIQEMRKEGGRLRRCPDCKQVFEERVLSCDCGHKFATGREISEYDGQLYELRSAVPEGCVTRQEFAKRIGVAHSVVYSYERQGILPVEESGHVVLEKGKKWFAWYKKYRAPFGFSCVNAYAERHKTKYQTIQFWRSKGMPWDDRFGVPITEADAWVDTWLKSHEVPKGLKSQSEVAKQKGISITTLYNWRRADPNFPRVVKGNICPIQFEKYLLSRNVGHALRTENLCTAQEFAEHIGLTSAFVYAASKAGMPHELRPSLLICKKEAGTWLARHAHLHKTVPPFDEKCPHDFESQSHFARRGGVKQYLVNKYWAKQGLPCASNGWVHIQRGLEWVRDNTNIKIPDNAWPKPQKKVGKRVTEAELRAGA